MVLKKEVLVAFTGKNIADKFYDILVQEMEAAGINTKLRICAFMAQILHESANLYYTKELTGHTTKSMMRTWPGFFKTPESTLPYLGNPVKLFNYVYDDKNRGPKFKLGNTQPGDGWKFIGRGIIGNTGREMYEELSKEMGIDFVNHPELLEQPLYAVKAAVHFWSSRSLNILADTQDFKSITRRVNGAQIGAADREAKYSKLLQLVR